MATPEQAERAKADIVRRVRKRLANTGYLLRVQSNKRI
jgi:hypothetical protein